MKKAKEPKYYAINLMQDFQGGRKKMRVYQSTQHPSSSYGIPVWVTSSGDCLGQVGLPILGWDIREQND